MPVDCHAHIMTDKVPLVSERHSAPHRDVFVEEYLDVLDSFGMSHGVLTQPSFYGTDNSMLLDALARYPDRLRGTVIVDLDISEQRLAELKAAGVCGIRLNWFQRERLPNIAEYANLFGLLRELDLHVEVYIEGTKLPSLMPTIQESGVSVVLDHFAAPDPLLRTECPGFRSALKALEGGRCHVKLSAPYRLGDAPIQPYVDALMAAGGPEHLVWGSDWPWVSNATGRDYRQLQDLLEQWIPDDADRSTILTATPMTLYRCAPAQAGKSSTLPRVEAFGTE
ncbi:amidohydrolase family protein [Terrihabitans sp. B22-R8]|uniref:amidohydrolase family protein n=1 Tax=Terrihabitans sp. B22-R8 TaxID=3425128 RepID=UPI00403D0C82